MRRRTHRNAGSSILEMTLIGIPMLFVLISTIEIARGMWIYHTLAYSLREGTRYTIVHGSGCKTAPNTCSVTIGQIATKIRDAAVGLYEYGGVTDSCPNSSSFCIQMTDSGGGGMSGPETLAKALADTTVFPTSSGDSPQTSYVTFTATYPFRSAIAMFWPGAGKGMNFATVTFPASSQEKIQY